MCARCRIVMLDTLGVVSKYYSGMLVASLVSTVLRRKSKDWLAQNQDNVSKWGIKYICELFFQ
jgi:hypothetical protein